MEPIRGSMKQNEGMHRSEACSYTSCLMKSTLQCLQTVPSLVALSKVAATFMNKFQQEMLQTLVSRYANHSTSYP
jgi:hypothetical protein